jgi:hypothetical protein
MLTIDIVILTDVVDLSNQVIEFGENCDDRYCEMLNWKLNDRAIETFSCPRRLKEGRFEWQ